MPTTYISIGSNIAPEENIRAALRLLRAHVSLDAVSTLYHTAPIGNHQDPTFINAVLRIETDIPAKNLKFDILRAIEQTLARTRTEDKSAPRTIDLDIILYGNEVISAPDITIPDPDIFTRAFIAAPLAELDPDLILPGGKRIADVADALRDQPMTPLPDLTAALRTEVTNEPG